MEIVVLVFFLAIFGGILFLLALIWFVFRLFKKSRSGASNRNFSSSSNYGSSHHSTNHNFIDSDDDSEMIYTDNSSFENQYSETTAPLETAHDLPQESENVYSHASHGESAAPSDTSYSESSSYSSSDSSSSYDSGSSSDSSSSDSGGSSSSSSD